MRRKPGSRTSTGRGRPSSSGCIGPRLLLLFIVGDILGTGVYALTGSVAGEVGGAAWAPFLAGVRRRDHHRVLVPGAGHQVPAGRRRRALHAQGVRHPLRHVPGGLHRHVLRHHVARRRPPTRSPAYLNAGFALDAPGRRHRHHAARTGVHGARGRGQPPRRRRERQGQRRADPRRAVGPAADHLHRHLRRDPGHRDFSRVMVFESPSDKSVFLAVTAATSLAFFAMVGFEDSVNMAEESQDPIRDFPKMMLTGLGVDGRDLHARVDHCGRPGPGRAISTNADLGPALLQVVAAGAPELPVRQDLPVHQHVRRRQLGAHQHADGEPAALRHGPAGRAAALARQGACRRVVRRGWRSSSRRCCRFGLIIYVVRASASEDGSPTRPARRHHRAPAARGVHRRQRRTARAAQAARRPRPLPGADVPAGDRCADLRLPGRVRGPARRQGAVQDRRR